MCCVDSVSYVQVPILTMPLGCFSSWKKSIDRDSTVSRIARSSMYTHNSISCGADPGSSDAVVGMCSTMIWSGYILLLIITARVDQMPSLLLNGEHQQSPCSSHFVRADSGGFGLRIGRYDTHDRNLDIILSLI